LIRVPKVPVGFLANASDRSAFKENRRGPARKLALALQIGFCCMSLAIGIDKARRGGPNARGGHRLALCTSGMGVGQFLAPIYRIVVPSGSFTRRCISKYLCTKSARVCMSSVASPDEMICFPSGPRSSRKAFSLLLCMAETKALLASSGDENVL
jgi:hypothetical protein